MVQTVNLKSKFDCFLSENVLRVCPSWSGTVVVPGERALAVLRWSQAGHGAQTVTLDTEGQLWSSVG